jgi:hypothetical protein
MVLMVAMMASMSVTADTDAVVSLDKSWYTNETALAGDTVKITVTDAEANTTTARVDLNSGNATYTWVANAAIGVPATVVTTQNPIVGTVRAVAVTSDTDLPNVSVTVVDATLGIVQLISSAVQNDTNFDLKYSTGAIENINVNLKSTQVAAGITVALVETGTDTGIFEKTVNLHPATTAAGADPITLQALNLNTVTATYVDTTPKDGGANVNVTAQATVETSDATFASLLPADLYSTQATQPTLTGTIHDSGGSGIDISTVQLKIYNAADSLTQTLAPTVTGSDGDTTVTYSVVPSALTEAVWTWQVTVNDMAGNASMSDHENDPALVAKTTLKVDQTPPGITSATTGKSWNTDTDAEVSNDVDSLVVLFDEAIDADSVSAADFTVENNTVTAATAYADAAIGTVYISLGVDLAADADPEVSLAVSGAVSDTAGNARNTGSVDAADGIAPTFTVTLDKTLTDGKVTASISADEDISGVPVVTVHNEDNATTPVQVVTVLGNNTWEVEVASAANLEGDNSFEVTGTDGANAGSAGAGYSAAGVISGGIMYELDLTDPTQTAITAAGTSIAAAGATDVESTNPYIAVTFSEAVTVTKATFGEDGEDGTDILAVGSASSDSKKWIYAASGLTVGTEYFITLEFEDAATNEVAAAVTTEFEAAEKADTEIAVSPGNNLVSLPGDPADSAIATVIVNPDVSAVNTYDGTQWLSATRNADGTWDTSGGLTSIDSSHAYWVTTSSFAPIEVAIPDRSFTAAPPAIAVVAGWNLVPVTSVTGAAIGSTIAADTYFGSLTNWVTAYSYSPSTNAWTKVLPKNFDNVTVGSGYWVYASEAGILVP